MFGVYYYQIMKTQAENRMLFLSKLPFFKDLNNEQLEKISPYLKLHKFSAGDMVCWEGEPSNGVFFVKTGWLKVTKTSEKGRELTLNLLKKGDYFNLISVFTDNINPADIKVLEDAELYFLDATSFEEFALSSPVICLSLVRQMAGRVRMMADLAGQLSLRNVEMRIASWLLSEAVGDSIERRKWLTQNELASIVGTVPDVISRVLREFVEAGLIRFNRREIKIIDRASLTEKIRNSS